MEFITDNFWIVWLAVAGIMLVIEMNTTALVSIWFVMGAVASAVVSFFLKNIPVQIIVFLGISFFCLFLFRLLYKEKIMTKKGEEAEYSPVGKNAIVVEAVSSVGGKVRLDDVYWKAVCDEETEISVDTVVVVVASEGTTLKVKLLN